MYVKYLHSSSSGNATLVKSDEHSIIIDAGVSYKQLKAANDDTDLDIDAIVITHEHTDHISGLGVLGRKTDAVIFIPELSYEKIKSTLKGCKINFIKGGDVYNVGDLKIKAFSTRHDSLASVGYIISDKNGSYGHVTDTGVITPVIANNIKDCDALFMESDYDMYALERYDGYDDVLKMRIQSRTGHLSNQEVIRYLATEANFNNLKWVMLGHLSIRTNSPDILKDLLVKYIEKSKLPKINIFNNPTELLI